MARNVGTIKQGGNFFSPSKFVTAIAIAVETKSIAHGVSNTYKGKTTERDEVTADITVFLNLEALEQGEPSEVIKGGIIGHGALVNAVREGIPMEYYVIVRKENFNSGNSGYVFSEVDAATGKKVEAYLDKRDKAREAALAAVPDF